MRRKLSMDVHESKECVVYVGPNLSRTICGWNPSRRRDTLCYNGGKSFHRRRCVRREKSCFNLIQGRCQLSRLVGKGDGKQRLEFGDQRRYKSG